MMKNALIMIVEDEILIRMAAAQMLEEAGFSVIEACNADDALVALELRNDIRAVLSDINMPGTLDGVRLVHAIRDRWPPIHLILTSGLMLPLEQAIPLNCRFIPKPYEPGHVIATIRELLASDPPLNRRVA